MQVMEFMEGMWTTSLLQQLLDDAARLAEIHLAGEPLLEHGHDAAHVLRPARRRSQPSPRAPPP